MKYLLLTFTLLFTSQITAQSLVQNKTDEFTGNRVVQSDDEQISHDGFSGKSYIGAIYTSGDYAIILTVVSNDSWQLLSTDKAYVVSDGERMDFRLHRFETDVSSGVTIEQYGILVSRDELRQFADSNDFRIRANRNIYTVSVQAKDAFRLVLNETIN